MSFKRADYLLPAYPGMAIFLGVCAERWLRQCAREPDASLAGSASDGLPAPSLALPANSASGSSRWAMITQGGFALLLLACVAGWLIHNTWFIPPEERAWPYLAMAQKIRRQTHGPVIFFRAESHLFMHHLGQPVDTILEWENLDWWVRRPAPVYVVMPEKCAEEWRAHLGPGALEEVLRTADYVHGKRDRRLVVLRSAGKLAANQ